MVEIRRGGPGDAEALRRLGASLAGEEPWTRRIVSEFQGREEEWVAQGLRGDRAFFLALDGGEAVGLAWSTMIGEEAERYCEPWEQPWAVEVAVMKGRRREGLGSMLVAQAIREARRLGATTLLAFVDQGNVEAADFLRAVGFREAARDPGARRAVFKAIFARAAKS